MPRPRAGESRQSFIPRFMRSEEAKSDFPDRRQRYAVARNIKRKPKLRKH